MIITKAKLQDEEIYELLDHIIYGTSVIYKYLGDPSDDLRDDIKRCTDATKSLNRALMRSSLGDVCDNCSDEYESLINATEESVSDLDVHLDYVVNAYRNLEDENQELKRVIQTLSRYALDAVTDDELKTYEERIILEKLEGTR